MSTNSIYQLAHVVTYFNIPGLTYILIIIYIKIEYNSLLFNNLGHNLQSKVGIQVYIYS